MVPADASAFYAKNLENLLGIMVDNGDAGPVLKDLAEDEVSKAMRMGVASE
jgi:NAD(P) transhydrogenase subunit alpha